MEEDRSLGKEFKLQLLLDPVNTAKVSVAFW